jgi:hypothetical protein
MHTAAIPTNFPRHKMFCGARSAHQGEMRGTGVGRRARLPPKRFTDLGEGDSGRE